MLNGELQPDDAGVACALDKRRRMRLTPELLEFMGCHEGDKLMFVDYNWKGSIVTEVWGPKNWDSCYMKDEECNRVLEQS